MLKTIPNFVLSRMPPCDGKEHENKISGGVYPPARLFEGRTGQTKFGMYLLSRHAPCGLAWDKARLDAPGLGG